MPATCLPETAALSIILLLAREIRGRSTVQRSRPKAEVVRAQGRGCRHMRHATTMRIFGDGYAIDAN